MLNIIEKLCGQSQTQLNQNYYSINNLFIYTNTVQGKTIIFLFILCYTMKYFLLIYFCILNYYLFF